MIHAIQGTSKLLGERDIMWSNVETEKKGDKTSSQRLSKEIFGLFGISFLIAVICFWILNEAANRLVLNYAEEELLMISENQLIDIQYGILGISFVSGIILFVVLFLFLIGERLAYIREVVKGIDALGRHAWDYEIPLRGKNELTELAKRVNELFKEEEAFQIKERQLQEEKMSLIRSLSHDIRTPLTSMMAYSEYMKPKENVTVEEMKAYMELVEQKCQQIKVLTDRLLDGGGRHLERIENGKFLMEQLVDAWSEELEEEFSLVISLEECPAFSAEIDVDEMRRIFDNLASNIRKYADATAPVFLEVKAREGYLCMIQKNKCKVLSTPVESTKIGIESIRKIVAQYGGFIDVSQKDEIFRISLEFPFLFL